MQYIKIEIEIDVHSDVKQALMRKVFRHVTEYDTNKQYTIIPASWGALNKIIDECWCNLTHRLSAVGESAISGTLHKSSRWQSDIFPGIEKKTYLHDYVLSKFMHKQKSIWWVLMQPDEQTFSCPRIGNEWYVTDDLQEIGPTANDFSCWYSNVAIFVRAFWMPGEYLACQGCCVLINQY